MVRSTRRSVTMASAMKRERGDHIKDEEIDDMDDDAEDDDVLCVVCTTANARVTVACAACAKTYHLACHSPPLRRRPASESTWECSQCGQDTQEPTPSAVGAKPARRGKAKAVKDETVEVAVKAEENVSARKRRRGAAEAEATVQATDDKREKEKEEEEDLFETTVRKTKTRRSTKATVPTTKAAQQEDDDAVMIVDAVAPSAAVAAARTPVKQRVAKLRAPSASKPPGKKAPRKPVKVQEVELASKQTSRAATRKRVGRGGAIKPHRYVPVDDEEEEEEEDGGGDDDNDSDFSGSEAEKEEAEEEEEEEEEEDEASDEDFEKPVKRPVRKAPPPMPRNNKADTKKPAKETPKRKPAPKKVKTTKQDDAADDEDDSDAAIAPGNAAAPLDVDSEGDIEEEVYTGPSYFVEYAPNARASCKSCEQKLAKESLRVGVKVKHSMFGITTYFKHVECTQICVVVSNDDDDDAPLGGDPIRGLSSLKPKDKAFVLAHMRKNTELGLLDERRELSEDQYARKTRMPEKEPSPLLTATLLPYQREALAWMTAQEQGEYKGGILADEMGMGKTIQAISLILENPRDDSEPPAAAAAAPPPAKKGKARSQKVEFKTSVRGGTLVVCPLVAVMQWKSEIERFVESNHFSIYIHHGPKRLDLVDKIAAYDIVLTTYSIIESESRKTLGWEKVPCKYCKKKYLPDKLILHNKYFCGPNAKKTALQDRQQTKKKGKKAAGDASSDDEDDDDLKKPVKGKKKPAAKKNNTKKKKIESDSDDDDDDDDMDAKPQRKPATGKSPMHQIHWTRIVLDEAHYIKDRRCNTARGVFELKADYRWCLTGTPLQNRIGELFSLVRFLQIKHYAYYHCNKCECQKLDFDFPDGKCQECDHPAMQHFSFFNKKIVVPIQSYGYVAEGKVAMLRLQNELLQHILLRRTKDGRADDISLPPKLVRVRRDRLDERENDFYQAIYTQSQAQFNTYVSSGTLLNNYAHIFDLLIRLRQAVDHPYLVIYSKSNPALQVPVSLGSSEAKFARPVVKENALISVVDDDQDALAAPECVICHEDAEDPVAASCSHQFCRECVKEFIESLPDGASATCPDCEKPLTVDLSPPKPSEDEEDEFVDPHKPVIHRAIVDLKRYSKHSILHRISDLDSFQTSTKIEALMQELEHMKIRDPSGKAIIFSQFVNMLDIIQHRLTIGGIKCVKLSGNMTMDLRDRTIRAFREDNSITVFLISLKAGGVALNLTIASHIFLMDPWWNPAAENQAIDRTHRLGQFKPVEATRFIIAGTIEERILKLQEKKRLIFEGTVGGSVSAICRLTEDDLRFLFSK